MARPAEIRGTVKTWGMRELDDRLRTLETSIAVGITRKGLREGAKVVRNAVLPLVPERTGQLKQSIKVRSRRSNRRGVVSFAVTTGEATFVGDTYYGGFQEWGWMAGKRGESGRITLANGKTRHLKTGSQRRKIPGEHYMEYGFEASAQAATDVAIYTWIDLANKVWAGRANGGGMADNGGAA